MIVLPEIPKGLAKVTQDHVEILELGAVNNISELATGNELAGGCI